MLDPDLLRRILADPDADGLRLVLAADLDRQPSPAGRAHAELIRIQCELAREPVRSPRRWQQLKRREAELLSAHSHEWAAPFRALGARPTFLRGLAEAVTLPAAAFLQHARALFALGPIRRVKLEGAGPLMKDLARFPDLALVRDLDLAHNDLSPAQARHLAASPHLTGLRSLALSGNPGLGNGGASALARGAFPALEELDLTNADVHPAGVQALTQAPFFARLRALNLSFNPLAGGSPPKRRGLRHLLDARREVGWRSLTLERIDLERDELTALLDALGADLVELRLDGNAVGPEGARALAQRPHLSGLRVLSLREAEVTDEGAGHLAGCPHLRSLHTLLLEYSRLSVEGILLLARSANLRGLHTLNLRGNPIDPPTIDAPTVCELLRLPKLRELTVNPGIGDEALLEWLASPVRPLPPLWDQNLSDSSLRALLASGELGQPQNLNLGGNALTAAGVEALAASPVLTFVESLNLGANPLGPAGARALVESPHLRSLQYLSLDAAGLDDQAAAELARLSGSHLIALDLGSNPIGKEGLRAVLLAPGLSGLDALRVGEQEWEGDALRQVREAEMHPPAAVTVTDTEEALLRAIVQSPDDDAPRLVFADWLEENADEAGRAWSELIRVQCQLPREKKKRQRAKLEKRQAVLLEAHAATWLGPWIDPGGTTFHRGFVVSARLTADLTERMVEDLLPRPILAVLPHHLSNPDEQRPLFRLVPRMPRLAVVRTLRFSEWYLDQGQSLGVELLGSPYLTALEELTMRDCSLYDPALRSLAGNPALQRLRVLDLGRSNAMEVSGNLFTAEGVRALAGSPHLSNLEVLSLDDAVNVGMEGVRALLRSTTLNKLRILDLTGTNLSDDDMQELADSPFCSRLRQLALGAWYYQDLPLGDPAAAALAASPHLRKLEKLTLMNMTISYEVADQLRAAFGDRVVIQ